MSWRIIAPVLFVFAGLSLWFFVWRGYEVYHAVPGQSALVLTLSGTDHLKTIASGKAGGFAHLSLIRVLASDLGQALALLPGSAENPDITLAAAFSLNPNDSLHPLLVLDLGSRSAAHRLFETVTGTSKIASFTFRGHEIVTVETPGKSRFAVAVSRNLVLLSRHSYLVEDALVQTGKRDSWWQEQAARVQAPVRAVLHPGTLAERLRGQLAPGWDYLPGRFVGQYTALVLGFDGKRWAIAAPPQRSPDKVDGGQLPHTDIAGILPDNTALLAWASTQQPGALGAFTRNGANDSDFQRFVNSWAGKEAAWVLTEPYSPGIRDDRFWVCSIRDAAVAQKSLMAYGERAGLLQRYAYQTFEISQFFSRSLLEPLLQEGGTDFQNPVCVLLDGYAVIGANPAALELWIDKYIVNQTLANQPDFLLLDKQMPTLSDRFLFFNAAFTSMIATQLLNPDVADALQSDIILLQNSGLFGLDLSENGTGNLVNYSSSAQIPVAGILWKTPLNGQAITQPYLVPATQPDKESTLLIQDDQFYLHCLTVSGNLLWRKKLDKPIQSEVRGIDFFGNGGVCYLFNTATDLWILDSEGREIAGYPLHLKSPATNGVTAVDFNDDHKYGLFVACENGNLYGFDQYGRPLTGWNPQSGVGQVRHPLIHFKSETKDYLAVLGRDGQLSVFNRIGVPLLAPMKFDGDFSANPPQFEIRPENQRIICMDASGKAYCCNLTGQVTQFDLGNGGNRHWLVIDGTSSGHLQDFAVLSGRSLVFSGYGQDALLKKATLVFSETQDTLFATGSPGLFGTLNRSKRQIYLVNSAGKMLAGFPLAGTTPFSLYQMASDRKSSILFAGNGASICAYRVPK